MKKLYLCVLVLFGIVAIYLFSGGSVKCHSKQDVCLYLIRNYTGQRFDVTQDKGHEILDRNGDAEVWWNVTKKIPGEGEEYFHVIDRYDGTAGKYVLFDDYAELYPDAADETAESAEESLTESFGESLPEVPVAAKEEESVPDPGLSLLASRLHIDPADYEELKASFGRLREAGCGDVSEVKLIRKEGDRVFFRVTDSSGRSFTADTDRHGRFGTITAE